MKIAQGVKVVAAGLSLLAAGCAELDSAPTGPQWKPIGNRKAKVVLWGIVHNHARGKFDALLSLTNDYEIVGWVDDSASKAMRMREHEPKRYAKWP